MRTTRTAPSPALRSPSRTAGGLGRPALLPTMLFALLAVPAAAEDRYVAPGGSNGNDCLSSGSPCATIQGAVGKAAFPRNASTGALNIHVADGSYAGSGGAGGGCSGYAVGLVDRVCTASQPCRIEADNVHQAIVDHYQGFCFDDSHHWTISGIDIDSDDPSPSSSRYEIHAFAGSSNIVVEDVYMVSADDDRGPALRIVDAVDGFTARRMTLDRANACAGEDWAGGGRVVVARSTNVVVEESELSYTRNLLQCYNASNITFRRNKIMMIANHGFEIHDCSHFLVENNVYMQDTDNANCTIAGGWPSTDDGRFGDGYCGTDVTYRNNTVVGNGETLGMIWWMARQPYECDDAAGQSSAACNDGLGDDPGGCGWNGLRSYNNVWYDNRGRTSYGAVSLPTTTMHQWSDGPDYPTCSDYNAWGRVRDNNGTAYVNGFDTLQSVQGSLDLNGDSINEEINGIDLDAAGLQPADIFADYGARDYRPASGSPLIDAGADLASLPCPSSDFEGNPRSDGSCDIGAFEHQEAGPQATCGNGVIEVDEACDMADLAGKTCQDVGFTLGTLACATDCTAFDTSGCIIGWWHLSTVPRPDPVRNLVRTDD